MSVVTKSLSVLAVALAVGVVFNPQDAKAWDRNDHQKGHQNGHKQYSQHNGHHSYRPYVIREKYYDYNRSGFSFSFPNGAFSLNYSRPVETYTVVRPRPIIVRQAPVIIEPRPVVYESPRVLVSAPASSAPVTVNVPNRWGGYTAVTMIPSGSGFIGPQGEFYYTFPSVDQLRFMYAK